jgi:sialic acid synthase SpsE
MSDMAEVHQALEAAGTFDGYSTVLLVCTSQYPTPPDEANLARLRTLRGAFPNLLVGFSDHTRDHVAAAVAVAYGACLLEKHFTLDHSLPGPDHGFSQDPGELAEWVRTVRTAEAMIGDGLVRPSARELANKREFQRVIVAVRPIEAGDVFTHENLGMRRVPGGRGLPPALLDRVLGKTAARSYRAGDAVEQ